MPRKVYWDACTFIGLINRELDKHADCLAVWNEAKEASPRTIIHTSFFTYAEVFKAKCEGKSRPLSIAGDMEIESILQQAFVMPALVDEQIGVAARRLMRMHNQCKKPSDAIHLATALRLNVDEMHTYDGSDLLRLNGAVTRKDGQFLVICKPNALPLPTARAMGPPPAPLLEWLDDTEGDR